MTQETRYQVVRSTFLRLSFGVIAALAAGLATQTAANAQEATSLAATPGKVVFHSMDDSATIQITRGAAPLPSSEIKRIRALADDHDYIEMFQVERSKSGPATITIKANPNALEVGSYLLTIETAAGSATVDIQAPLDTLKSVVDQKAHDKGVSEIDARKELGLVTANPYESITISLPEKYTVGQALSIELPAAEDRVRIWKVNDAVVKEGKDAATLTYVFEKPGGYEISLTEKKGGAVVAEWVSAVTVEAEPATPWATPINAPFTLNAPAGYGKYIWKVDGKEVASGATLKYKFTRTGEYPIECTASEPQQGTPSGFRRVVWQTTVTQK